MRPANSTAKSYFLSQSSAIWQIGNLALSSPHLPRPWHNTRWLIGPALLPFYRAAVARRNARFDRGHGIRRIPLPVISVGNLTTGGTGKTPMVMLICRQLLAMGHHPAIALRGYKADASGHSDEADEYRRTIPSVPVILGANRWAAITAFLAHAEGRTPDCIVLDDGFQHRQLHRDLDIVLLSAEVDLLTEPLLPAGDLREPLANLRRAGLVILTHAAAAMPAINANVHWSCRLPPGLPHPTVLTQHTWHALRDRNENDLPLNTLAATPTLALCAIGSPTAFFAAAQRTCTVVRTLALPDHAKFDAATVRDINATIAASGARAMLVTEKDWSKLRTLPAEAFTVPIYRAALKLEILAGDRVLASALQAALTRPK